MTKSQDYKLLENDGRKQEKAYHWASAANVYNKALMTTLKHDDLTKAVEISERVGLCLYHAAMQAGNPIEFKRLMVEASTAYSKAVALSRKLNNSIKLAKTYHCEAMVIYINSWLEQNSTSRKKLLEESWKLEKKAQKIYEKTNDLLNLGKTYIELNRILTDILDLEWNPQLRKKIFDETLTNCNDAIAVLCGLDEDYELARAHYIASIQFQRAARVSKPERKSTYEKGALENSRKSVKLSKITGDQNLIGLANLSLGSCFTDFSDHPNTAIDYFENALQCGSHTRDKYLLGRASYLLAHQLAWKMVAEEDPEKMRAEAEIIEEHIKNAIKNFTTILKDQEIASCYYWYAENYITLARSTETTPQKKLLLLRKSIKVAKKGLKHAQRSGSITAKWFILHPLSKSLFYLSIIEKDKDEKKRVLEKALKYRLENIRILEIAMPNYFWNHAVYQNYLALIQSELAEIETENNRKAQLLRDGMSSAESCINLSLKTRNLSRSKYATLAKYFTDFGDILTKLNQINSSNEILDKLLLVYRGAVEAYEKADLPSRTAESYWRLARVHSKLFSFEKSAKCFKDAKKQYTRAAKKIPTLERFYLDHATYMDGWNEIETARYYHMKQDHSMAKIHYKKAASLHESTDPWRYLVPNYLAWAQLEHGENLSREEQSEKARETFQHTAILFKEAKRIMKHKLATLTIEEEKKMTAELVKACDIRYLYCLGRIALEDAKIFERKGEYITSSQNYGSAAEEFQKAMNGLEQESDKRELKPIIYLCEAWQIMTRAEAEAAPHLYLKASELFEKAKEYSIDKNAKMLALGHSYFAKALEAGRRFEITRSAELYSSATQHLEGAASYYLKAGYKTAFEFVKATQRLLDAHMYTHKAKTEINPITKSQYYMMSERLLKATAASYMKARKPEESKNIKKLIESVKEEQELVLSLTEVFQTPTIMSTTTSFSTPTPTYEKAVGLERFEHLNIQVNMDLKPEEIEVAEDFNLNIQIANVGKEAVLLHSVEGIIPKGFELVSKPDICGFKDGCLDLKGTRLDPLKVEELRLVLRSFNKGNFKIRPRLVYIDETGHQSSLNFKPAEINVLEVILPERITTGCTNLDSLLYGGIPAGYSVILTSPSCDEKDRLTRNYVECGVKDGQVTFFVTIKASGLETLAEKFQSSFSIFVCNPRIEMKLRDLPNVFQLKGVENLTEISIALASAFRQLDKHPKRPRRTYIDIVSDVLLQHHSVSTRRWLAGLLPDLRSRGFTTLALINPYMHPLQEVQAILDLFEGEITIYEKETEKGPQRFLRVKRMLDKKYLESELLLKKERLVQK